ncbi:hypothetical protein ABPG75_004888 [Micractinium tetrahymenae]
MKPAVSLLLLVLAAATGGHALSPPWWQAANIIQAGLAADKYAAVTVKDVGSELQINVQVALCCKTPIGPGRRLAATEAPALPCIKSCPASTLKAASLSTLLAAKVKADNAKVAGTKLAVSVTQGGKVVAPGALPTKPDAVATQLNRALLGNAYFKEISLQSLLPGGALHAFAIFHPKVAQVFMDDLSQSDGLQTFTAAQLMDAAFDIAAHGVSPTTDLCTDCIVSA